MEVKWYKLEDLAAEDFMSIPKTPGIYFVRWSKNGKPVPIGRLGGFDSNGLVYVGVAYGRKGMKNRLQKLWEGITRKTGKHTIGMSIVFCKAFETIKPSEYEIAFEELKTRDDAIGQESASIGLYTGKYKEPPSLNLQTRREMFLTVGIGEIGKSRLWYEPDDFVRSVINSMH